MIIRQYIKDFEKLGFGLFVHFGLYSILGTGEWTRKYCTCVSEKGYDSLMGQFDPCKDWATNLVRLAKHAGCKYVTLTTRHHDGFSLFDTCGLNTYDAPHAKCGRDLVREFVDACNAEGVVPFFYHTLLDWHEESYQKDFPCYLKYLRKSVEILCTNYGRIGGLWFDGMWDKPDEDWEEEALYNTIRRYQPEAMIINNTGLSAQGELGHIELDSVTFERGKPKPINLEGSTKYVASEMCQVFGDHWGYAKEDLNYKSPAQMIRELADCRRYRSNFLANIGPKGDGSIREMDRAILNMLGNWTKVFGEALYEPVPTQIAIEGKPDDFILKHEENYYLFCYNLPMSADPNVALINKGDYESRFKLNDTIKSIIWLDNETEAVFRQEGKSVTVTTPPYAYGRNLVVRVAKIMC